ncbi:MAG: hypothetical protein V8Q76_08665 [Bacteroides intestinalis]
MKKIIFIVIAIILGLSSCHDDDYITGVPSFRASGSEQHGRES